MVYKPFVVQYFKHRNIYYQSVDGIINCYTFFIEKFNKIVPFLICLKQRVLQYY